MRYFIKLAYNGTNYHGWQYQPNASSVQETVNKAISVILNFDSSITGAGRTDSGVHAKEMFAHFDYINTFDCANLVHKLNSYLPKDIVILDIFPVEVDSHARFDAQKRTYEYHINTFKNPFLKEQSWFFPQELDIQLMNDASKILFDYTDFQCFSKVNTEVNSFDCTIFEANWTRGSVEQIGTRKENESLLFTISANRFLRNMVRAIVGTMVNLGIHKITLDQFEAIIKSKNRNEAGFSVPAHGLYLTKIEYDYL